ncbi:uncharacterized protein BJ212DRAFT_1586434 [Suillus subaureus]|uniref:Uncharacterized protein n=1 Tax=Suillus subaureus TaxID=48587 RepID=A0A9P7JG60_9AGAM|nr:uncharacterized protein BJ212DRAFT_1586434 [Suillus subaureus]KAG1820592.1 hypothetical protein BJ212DRAFT_1586434 [Suillus subaureus]
MYSIRYTQAGVGTNGSMTWWGYIISSSSRLPLCQPPDGDLAKLQAWWIGAYKLNVLLYLHTFAYITQPNFEGEWFAGADDTMKIQFAYLAILAAAAGVKSQQAYDQCNWDLACVMPNYDCGPGYAPFPVPLADCYLCCVIGY